MTFALLKRIGREKRVFIVPLAVALLVNVLATVLVVLPLAARVRAVEGQATQAAAAFRAAAAEHATAVATLEHKRQAEQDLRHFYTKVLPPDASGARRQTYVRLAKLAADADLRYLRRLEEVQEPRATASGPAPVLSRFEITMVLRGEYDSIRQFIRDVEASEQFVSIDDVSLAEGTEPGSPLVLNLVLSTYFRGVAP
jgi:Tfp pilus assembly protein PilO